MGKTPKLLSLAVASVFLIAACVAAFGSFSVLAETRAARWPLFVASAAVYALIGLLSVLGALVHPVALVHAMIVSGAFLVSQYRSESVYAPLVLLAILALGFAYWKLRPKGGVLVVGAARMAILALSAAFAVAAMSRMTEPRTVYVWEHWRTAAGGVELRTWDYDFGGCEVIRGIAKDRDKIDSACAEVIPPRRARFVAGFSTLSALLAIAGFAGAPKRRAIDDLPERPSFRGRAAEG